MQRIKNFFIFFSLLFIILLSGCPENPAFSRALLDFELSENEIKTDMPVEITVRWCQKYLEDEDLFSIMKLENVEMELLEGELIESDDLHAIFVKFIRPIEDVYNEKDSPYYLCPYCKLKLTFKKSGSYKLRFMHTNQSILNSNFNDGYMYKVINVKK